MTKTITSSNAAEGTESVSGTATKAEPRVANTVVAEAESRTKKVITAKEGGAAETTPKQEFDLYTELKSTGCDEALEQLQDCLGEYERLVITM